MQMLCDSVTQISCIIHLSERMSTFSSKFKTFIGPWVGGWHTVHRVSMEAKIQCQELLNPPKWDTRSRFSTKPEMSQRKTDSFSICTWAVHSHGYWNCDVLCLVFLPVITLHWSSFWTRMSKHSNTSLLFKRSLYELLWPSTNELFHTWYCPQ